MEGTTAIETAPPALTSMSAAAITPTVTVAPTLTPESAVVAGIRDATAPITVTVTAAPDHVAISATTIDTTTITGVSSTLNTDTVAVTSTGAITRAGCEGVASLQQGIESTNTEDSLQVESPPQGEASENYENCFGK